MTTKNGTGLIEHAVIDRAFRELIDAFGAKEELDPSTLYRVLEERIRTHFRAEEVELSRFIAVDAEEARALLAEHRALEATMDVLAAKVARGALQLRDGYEFRARFSVHEAREETGFYRRKKYDDGKRSSDVADPNRTPAVHRVVGSNPPPDVPRAQRR